MVGPAGQGGSGLLRRYIEKMTGLSRAQGTRLIAHQVYKQSEHARLTYKRYQTPLQTLSLWTNQHSSCATDGA